MYIEVTVEDMLADDPELDESDFGPMCGTPQAHENGCCDCDPDESGIPGVTDMMDSVKDMLDILHERTLMEAYSEEWDRNTPKYDGDDRTPIEMHDAGFLNKREFWSLVFVAGIGHKFNDDGTDPGNCSVCHFYHH